jgi:general secretion pathway protein D
MEAAGQTPPDQAQQFANFNFTDVEIGLVVDVVGKMTGKRFVVGESITGKVSVVTSEQIPAEEIYPLFLSILETSGYSVVERNDALHIIRLPKSKVLPAPIIGPDEDTDTVGIVQQVFKLKNVSAVEAKKALEPFVRGGSEGAISVFPPTNHLIITDTRSNITRLEKLIEEFDKSGAGGMVDVVTLTHASAEEVARQVTAAIQGTESANTKVSRHMQQVAGGGGSLPIGVSVIPDSKANTLLIVGPAVQIEEAKRIIAMLDVETAAGRGRLNSIPLKYLKAEDIAKSLTNLLAKNTKADQLHHIAVEPEISNNALLVDADPLDFDYVKKLVETLDVLPNQVLVEVLIAEVAMNDGLDLGVEWASIDSPTDGSTTLAGRSRPGETDGITGLATTGLFPQGLALGVARGTFTDPSGNTVARVPFLLRALASERDVKVISKPALMAQNNKKATVTVVDNIPILESTIEGSAGAANRDVVQNIKRQDVGLELSITPHINPNLEVTMDINPRIETIIEQGPEGTAFAPTITKREITTTVTTPNGSTVIISGLIREDTIKEETGVPFLRNIPVLGRFFQNSNDRKQRTNLLVFVTPYVVTDLEDANRRRQQWERDTDLTFEKSNTLNPAIPDNPTLDKK